MEIHKANQITRFKFNFINTTIYEQETVHISLLIQ